MCVCVCVCRPYSTSFHFTADPINPPIFRTFRSLWLLQTFGWPSCVAVWHPPQKSAQQLSSTYSLLLFHTPGILLPSAQSCEFVCVPIVIDWSLVHSFGRPQTVKFHSVIMPSVFPCPHSLFLPSFIFKFQISPLLLSFICQL